MMNLEDVQVVVLMGGLGTRLKEYSKNCPKSLVKVNDRPFFDYSLELLKNYGFKKFLFLVGHMATMVEDYYKDGSDFGVFIQYSYDGETQLGTGGAVRRALHLLEEDFLLIYGDSFMDINYEETVYRYFKGKESGKRALMTVLENGDRFDKSNVIYKDKEIVLYDKKNKDPLMQYIDYGVCMYERSLFEDYEENKAFDIAEIQNRLSISKEITAHEVTKRFYEIGSPESLKEFEEYVKARFDTKKPAVFLDRDGVLNEIVFNENTELLDSPMNESEFKMFDYVTDALKIFKEKGYYIFVVTNQPAAAKGKTTLNNLYDINTGFVKKMESEGISIEEVFMCPHHPNPGPLGKDIFLKQICECRKPKAGLINKALNKYNIDIEKSYMIGDSFTDIQCGKTAGVKTVFIGDYKCDVCAKLSYDKPDMVCKNVLVAAQSV